MTIVNGHLDITCVRVYLLDMTKTCATDGCNNERVMGNKGAESYCRQHKNEIARATRAASKGPEVFTQQVCANVNCDTVFQVSSWGQLQRYCSPECRDGAPKAARAVARGERQEQRVQELAAMTEKFCPGLRASGGEPEVLCGMRPVGEFYIMTSGLLDSSCKEHRKMAGRRYDAAHPGTRREGKRLSSLANRLSKYSYEGRPMTLEDRAAELERNPMCHDCGKVPATDVDHDHETMIYRGMLCRRCNLVLSSETELNSLVKHIEYLHRAEQKGIPFPVGYQSGPALCVTCDERSPEPGRRFCRECRNATEAEARVARKESLRGRPCAHEGCSEPRRETPSQVLSYCAKHWRERPR